MCSSKAGRAQSGVAIGIVAAAIGAAALIWWNWPRASSKPPPEEKKEASANTEAGTTVVQEAAAPAASKSPPPVVVPQPSKFDIKKADKTVIMDILAEIRINQSQMNKLLDRVVDEINDKNMTILDTYNRIKEDQPPDPLEAKGVTLKDFDALLDRFQDDESITNAVLQILQGNDSAGDGEQQQKSGEAAAASSSADLTVERIIEINRGMQYELARVADEMDKLESSGKLAKLDCRTASVAAQALVGAYVKRVFRVNADDVERAVNLHHGVLEASPEFFQTNTAIQETMNRLISRV